jgi:hypothetical protein
VGILHVADAVRATVGQGVVPVHEPIEAEASRAVPPATILRGVCDPVGRAAEP